MITSSAASQPSALDDAPTPPSPHDPADARLGGSIAAVCGIVVVVVLYVLHAALPATPFHLPFDDRQIVRALVPQGWAFFTLSPRTPDLLVWGAAPDGGWRRLSVGAHAVPSTVLGLDRAARSQGTEIGILASQIPAGDWSSCERQPTDCLGARPTGRTIANRSTHRTICGDVGLTIQETTPWAWRDLPTVMPSKTARVVVTC
ncbi:MAG TPA: SdpA family antimicrobial peptide system protein [Catenuloplanes sp.]|jgi:antimicrobial peptide system SdpA family protein